MTGAWRLRQATQFLSPLGAEPHSESLCRPKERKIADCVQILVKLNDPP